MSFPLRSFPNMAEPPWLSALTDAFWGYSTTSLIANGGVGQLLAEKLALITSGQIVVTSPVAVGGNVITYRGDSYNSGDGRALDWESDDWPDLTGATIAVIIQGVGSFAGSVVTPTGMAKVRLQLTATQSATIPAKRHNFQIVATQLDSNKITLVEAVWVSRARAEA